MVGLPQLWLFLRFFDLMSPGFCLIRKFSCPLRLVSFRSARQNWPNAVATTITDTLLTAADIRVQVEGLLTEKNIYASVDLFVDSVLLEFRDTVKLHRLASDIAELSPTLLHHLVNSTIDGLESGKDTRVANITDKLFDQVLLNTRISLDQATEIANRLMESFVAPAKIRGIVVSCSVPRISMPLTNRSRYMLVDHTRFWRA